MPDTDAKERVVVLMTRAELQPTDDFRFQHRLESRSEAIRAVIRLGLEAADKKPAA